jgi:hypothetical protein
MVIFTFLGAAMYRVFPEFLKLLKFDESAWDRTRRGHYFLQNKPDNGTAISRTMTRTRFGA